MLLLSGGEDGTSKSRPELRNIDAALLLQLVERKACTGCKKGQ
jgi:hypothetical protein